MPRVPKTHSNIDRRSDPVGSKNRAGTLPGVNEQQEITGRCNWTSYIRQTPWTCWCWCGMTYESHVMQARGFTVSREPCPKCGQYMPERTRPTLDKQTRTQRGA